jgi:hypothetical protein
MSDCSPLGAKCAWAVTRAFVSKGFSKSVLDFCIAIDAEGEPCTRHVHHVAVPVLGYDEETLSGQPFCHEHYSQLNRWFSTPMTAALESKHAAVDKKLEKRATEVRRSAKLEATLRSRDSVYVARRGPLVKIACLANQLCAYASWNSHQASS